MSPSPQKKASASTAPPPVVPNTKSEKERAQYFDKLYRSTMDAKRKEKGKSGCRIRIGIHFGLGFS
ncbi:hypothetical protein KP509_13G090800 [Ceratopteris richardii]|uniref:Uncharacterized protein n=1 Tax=Ceratopteris richardii TaxID=49495 RepID=A0A8T2TFQ4_CERRI|nr:hypothetical protein KP509_13G090800 [Ceratopteris richardii]